jgi:hypothetical protein
MQCAVRRWGPGTTCERSVSTTASKELQDRLTKLNAERLKQDSMWDKSVQKETTQIINGIVHSSNTKKQNIQ